MGGYKGIQKGTPAQAKGGPNAPFVNFPANGKNIHVQGAKGDAVNFAKNNPVKGFDGKSPPGRASGPNPGNQRDGKGKQVNGTAAWGKGNLPSNKGAMVGAMRAQTERRQAGRSSLITRTSTQGSSSSG